MSFVSLCLYVPDEGSLLPKYRDCTTSNDFESYIYIYIYITILTYVLLFLHTFMCSPVEGPGRTETSHFFIKSLELKCHVHIF